MEQIDEDTVIGSTATSLNSFKGKLQKLKDNSGTFFLGHWLSNELQWPSQFPWGGHSGNLSGKSRIPLRYPGRRQVRGWSQTCRRPASSLL